MPASRHCIDLLVLVSINMCSIADDARGEDINPHLVKTLPGGALHMLGILADAALLAWPARQGPARQKVRIYSSDPLRAQ